VVDPLNDAQPWEDFQRLVTHAVSVGSNLQQVKAGLEIATAKNGEKKTHFVGVSGPIKNQFGTGNLFGVHIPIGLCKCLLEMYPFFRIFALSL
jgi:hypothetical protein